MGRFVGNYILDLARRCGVESMRFSAASWRCVISSSLCCSSGFRAMAVFLDGPGKRVKIFDPVGFCIYCGAKDNLGEEHIIPLGLGGNLILPAASCPTCSDITGRQVEGAILNAYWGAHGVPRLRLNLPTRNPKKRPKKRSLKIMSPNGEVRTITISATDIPLAFLGMTTEHHRPGILRGAEPTDRFRGAVWLKYNDQELRKYAKPGETVEGIGKFNPFTYGRMICKIAHALATAEYGAESFKPFLPDVILGKSSHLTHYLGAQVSPAPDLQGLHNLHIGWLETAVPPYLVAYVRLFCNYGTPDYMIVVGQRRLDVARPL